MEIAGLRRVLDTLHGSGLETAHIHSCRGLQTVYVIVSYDIFVFSVEDILVPEIIYREICDYHRGHDHQAYSEFLTGLFHILIYFAGATVPFSIFTTYASGNFCLTLRRKDLASAIEEQSPATYL